jgi:hypothetical protein
VLRHANLRARLTLAPSKMRHAVSTSQPSTNPVKFAEPRPFSDPEAAVRKLIEIANTAEPVQDARIYIERVNGPFLAAGGSPAEYRAGIERAIAKGWLWRHESGTYVKFTDAGAELLGLAFGCIDLIVTPEGEHIFLEVNEMGQFLWVRTSQDQSCSAALRRYCSISGLGRRLGSSGMKDRPAEGQRAGLRRQGRPRL